MKIVLAPDKMKGSLTATQAAAALERGFRSQWPDASFRTCPIADGGEGTARTLCDALRGEWVTRTVRGPMGKPVEAGYAWMAEQRLAVIEMSEASGLALVPEGERAPLHASTFGTGELMHDAMERGARRLVLGLGGSATSDGGAGMAAALGYRFFTEEGSAIDPPTPARLPEAVRIDRENVPALPEVIAACDVLNPLLGPRGAARLFSPQKGATPAEVEQLEAALTHLADLAARAGLPKARECPGAGAAGGLGFGLMAFCNAVVEPGFELVASIIGLEAAIAGADLVITGEGSLDTQTLEGKGPVGVADLARRHGKPVIAFGGRVAHDEPRLLERFDAVVPLAHGPMSLPDALAHAERLLEAAAVRTARLCGVGKRFPGDR
ncbi:MAG TPA: glycerate kinase [Chthoniobacteraceae bacterium]|nr:glycerate kinase [Chthoniobacteraceae bacterium]